jgi:fatty-acyl-CoA synthase
MTSLATNNVLDAALCLHQVVVSRLEEGPMITVTYKEVHERARLCALALRQLGVQPGDRVGTLAWNNSRHLEAWRASRHSTPAC